MVNSCLNIVQHEILQLPSLLYRHLLSQYTVYNVTGVLSNFIAKNADFNMSKEWKKNCSRGELVKYVNFNNVPALFMSSSDVDPSSTMITHHLTLFSGQIHPVCSAVHQTTKKLGLGETYNPSKPKVHP